jgi:addiction module HigA family antidote
MLPTNRPPTHPGEMLLKEFLQPSGVSQVEAAKRMNIPFQRLNAIVKGRRGLSADTALLFEALTRWDAQIWLTLQAKWDLWHALRARGRRPRVKALHQSGSGRDVRASSAKLATAKARRSMRKSTPLI